MPPAGWFLLGIEGEISAVVDDFVGNEESTANLVHEIGGALRVLTELAGAEMDVLMGRRGLASRDEAYALLTRHVPLRHPASPDEVAAAIAFLCAPEASAITGGVAHG